MNKQNRGQYIGIILMLCATMLLILYISGTTDTGEVNHKVYAKKYISLYDEDDEDFYDIFEWYEMPSEDELYCMDEDGGNQHLINLY